MYKVYCSRYLALGTINYLLDWVIPIEERIFPIEIFVLFYIF